MLAKEVMEEVREEIREDIKAEIRELGFDKGKNLMQYNGYIARVEFDNDANIFHGEVINLRDVITFQGESVDELRRAFEESVDDYLAFCAERGEKPEKPYSGRFVVRIPPGLHRAIALQARLEDRSLNEWVKERLQAAVMVE